MQRGLEFFGIAELCQSFDPALFLLVGGVAIEMVAAEVLIRRAILEHVVDGGQDGGDDGHDRFGAAPGFEAIELGLQIQPFFFIAARAVSPCNIAEFQAQVAGAMGPNRSLRAGSINTTEF
jgi:hypothetical protein